jgi:hypothetical protein
LNNTNGDVMRNAAVGATFLATAMLYGVAAGYAQTSPTPGPTNPAPQSNPLAKPGSDLVVNPTEDECQKGWSPGLKWTQEQFEAFCKQMRTSK